MSSGNFLFFGTPNICLPYLEMLNDRFNLELIITLPDIFGGRNRKQRIIPPVKTFAEENNIEVEQPEILKDARLIDKIRGIDPVMGIVVSYGKFIPGSIFKIPEHRMINVHFSMLPLYRGSAPVQRAIENGDNSTGITIFEIIKRMDAGPIWAQREYTISSDDTTESVCKKLSSQGVDLLGRTIIDILKGKIQKYPQDENKVTFAPPIQKEEGHADWKLTAQHIFNKFRAFTPWPGLHCNADDKRFKLTKVRISTLFHGREPGDILSMDKKSLRICCGNGSVLEVLEFHPQGKKPMTPYCYCLGNKLPDRLE